MPPPPRPIRVEVIEEPDPDIEREHQIAALQLLIDFILEDRGAPATPEIVDSRAIA